MKNKFHCILLLSIISHVACCSCDSRSSEFIIAKDGQFIKNGQPYYFVGTNFWYGPILGSQGEGGGRDRLHRELDYLKSIGVDNLRVLVGVDGKEDIDSKVSPSLQPKYGEYNDELLDGLDYFMYQLGERDMSAVLYFTNAWEWSGGYTQYLMWADELDESFASRSNRGGYRFTATKFVQSEKAKLLLADHIKYIVGRTNRYTDVKYINDPAIFSWQICNEPRAFSKEAKDDLCQWIDETSTLIRSLDPNHMISTGSEGKKGSENDMELFSRIHKLENISYICAHMWAYNWRWIDASDMDNTIGAALETCSDYIDEHIDEANKIGKPLVFEEFGLPRDNEAISKESPTRCRDRLYKLIFDLIIKSKNDDGIFSGCNFWAWGGYAEQVADKHFWQKGMDYCGDPAQEAQGLNSVYTQDTTTIKLIKQTTTLINN